MELCSPIIDLRQYTLYPGMRDEFIELFDREFVAKRLQGRPQVLRLAPTSRSQLRP
jgi:hypothetical protein